MTIVTTAIARAALDRAIDAHLVESDIPISYTNVFWGGRSEIKPSEISPFAYKDWHSKHGA